MARTNHPHRLESIRRDLLPLSASDVLLALVLVLVAWWCNLGLIRLVSGAFRG